MAWSFSRRTLVLFVAVASLSASLPALAGSNAVFQGRVLGADGKTPQPGVVVTLVDEPARRTYDSAPADARGSFKVDSAPAGTYAVVARTAEGAYLAANSMTLGAGANRPVALALKASAEEPAGGTARADRLRNWQKWVIVGGIAIGAIVVADAVSSEEDSSSF